MDLEAVAFYSIVRLAFYESEIACFSLWLPSWISHFRHGSINISQQRAFILNYKPNSQMSLFSRLLCVPLSASSPAWTISCSSCTCWWVQSCTGSDVKHSLMFFFFCFDDCHLWVILLQNKKCLILYDIITNIGPAVIFLEGIKSATPQRL